MNRVMIALLGTVFLVGVASASGDIIWQDDFDSYPPGPIDGQGGWIAGPTAVVTAERARSMPHSLAIHTSDDALQRYEGIDEGRFVVSAWKYLAAEARGSSYFILLNTHNDEKGPNWSTQIHFDATSGNVTSDFDEGKVPLVRDEWVEVRVEVDLDVDRQRIFYDGHLLADKSWTDGLNRNGATRLQALDVFNLDQDLPIYWDDMVIVEPEPCPADLDGSFEVDFNDLLGILTAWGNKGGPEDLDGSGFVDFGDILVVLAAWGPCA